MIKGIGCDIVEISRIEKLMKNSRFLQKVYLPCEQKLIKDKSVHTAAGIWAAKEAASKALGTGFNGFTVLDIEICEEKSGKPHVKLHNEAEKTFEKFGGKQIYISISHEENHAMAFALIE